MNQSYREAYKPPPHVRKAMRIRAAGGPMCEGRDYEAANPCLIEPGHKGLHRGEGAAWSDTVYDAAPEMLTMLESAAEALNILTRYTSGTNRDFVIHQRDLARAVIAKVRGVA